ncbi:MAG TPA: ATP-binding protein [Rhodocyclaceae bacterium]|nr:ATP-binding protein [Rhodocyclaceae bacterium]
MKSIRRQLLFSMLLVVALSLAAGAFATYEIVHDQLDNVFDYHLRQIALSLRDQAFRNSVGPELSPNDQVFDFVIQVWSVDGVRLYLSHPHSTLPATARFGWSTVSTPDGDWRVFATPLDDEVIQVAQPVRVRNQLAISAALRAVMPIAFLMPALGILLWFVVGQGVAPLSQLARAVRSRTPDVLDPLPERDVPEEAQPLVRSLNDLLHRLDVALVAQRALIADAAHELRTPLTALQLQVQLLERERDEEERRQALAELKRGLQRATHVVAQLLTLARQMPDVNAQTHADVSLNELVGLVIADHAPLAEAKHIDLGAYAMDIVANVKGDFEALRTLLANLIGNAIRYTPENGHVDVALGHASAKPFVEVLDSGPGIPVDERERVFDRFYRGNSEGEHGSGLGLAIVRAIAQRHGAIVELGESPLGGLRARVSFPAQ